MVRVYLLFFITGILMIIFSFLVIRSETIYHYYIFENYYTIVARSIFLILAGVSLLFSVLYRFTGTILFSKTWSIMHFICFLCLFVNIWTWGILERAFFGDYLSQSLTTNQSIGESETFMKYQRIYLSSSFILTFLQLTYFVNLICGMIFQKSK